MPDPVLADIDIINRALGRIGGGAIMAIDEDTELAGQVMSVYPDIVDVAHTAYQWKWARRTCALDLLSETPVNGWKYAYGFPADALSQPLALLADPKLPDYPVRDFAVEGRKVYVMCEKALWGAFILRIAPSDWPPLFRAAVTTWLASALCVPVTHDSSLKQLLEREAYGTPEEGMRGGLMGRAIGVDAATGGNPAPLLASDPLTAARWDGPWHGNY
jgi:hypothetical protein